MNFFLGFALVLLATSASVNAGLDDVIENYVEDLGDFFKDKGQDWLDNWEASISTLLNKVDQATKTALKKLFEGTNGDALIAKLKQWKNWTPTKRDQELENDEDLKQVLTLLQKGGKGNGGPGPLALSGFLTTAMMSLFMLF